MRPADWHVLDLDDDPTPGDPWQVRSLVRSATAMSEDAAQAYSAVRSLASDGAVLAWVGLAGDVFRGAIQDFPVQLGKLRDSYDQAAEALELWASQLDGVQSTADRALEHGRQAQAEIHALSTQLATARSAASSAAAASDRLSDQPEGARELRISTARTVEHKLYDASDAGIEPKSRWERFKDAAARAWDVTIKIATVVVAVLSIVALIAGGPLVWGILFALSAALLADSLMKYARGEGSLWDVGLNMLGVIPGGRLVGAAGKLIGRSAQGARGLAAGSRALNAGRNAIQSMTTAVRSGLGRIGARLPLGEAGHVDIGAVLGAGKHADDVSDVVRPYLDEVDRLGVGTRPHAANFYSGGNGAAREAAENAAGRTGTTTLEQTPGGRWLDDQHLYETGSPLEGPEADAVWRQTSGGYAEQASGDVRAFTHDPYERGVWAQVEYPALVRGMDEGRITSIHVKDLQTGRSVTWRPGEAPLGGWKCP